LPPRTIGAYEILAVIGRGGIGTVYRARHQKTGEMAAVKLLGPGPAIDPTAARRLAREFETLQELDHPNVVRVLEAGVAEGYPFLAMELVDGMDLRTYLSPTLDDSIPIRPQRRIPSAFLAGSSSGSGPPASEPGKAFDVEALSAEPDTDRPLGGRGQPRDLPRPRLVPDPSSPSGPPSGSGGSTSGPDAIRDFATLMDEPETDTSNSGWKYVDLDAELAKLGEVEEPRRSLDPELLAAMNRPARLSRMRETVVQVLAGLSYIHSHGLVHRDLKPSNIMVDDNRRARLMDFGLVKMVAEETALTATGRVVGTYRYMAPEQALGERVDSRTDLYSLGVILYELLCGRVPFDAKNPLELWQQVIEKEPAALASLNPNADPGLVKLTHRLLLKDPDERYQTAEEVAEAIQS
jgi:serine/threonine protein kinase